MPVRPAAVLALGVSLGLALPAAAWENVRSRPGFAAVAAAGPAGWRAPHAPRRHWVPALESREPQVAAFVQPVFLPPLPSVMELPTVLDLPVQLGIREAPPAQPAVYVLNEGGRQPTLTGSIRVSAGPRIIDTSADMEDPAPAFGAKIIHLEVPVGRGY